MRNWLMKLALGKAQRQAANKQAGDTGATSERGFRPTPENRIKYLYSLMWVDPELRAAILDIRAMDRMDPRVKRIHGRTARAAVKGGLVLRNPEKSKTLDRRWAAFQRRLQLVRRDKLESDMRGLMMEGNLPLQWVLNEANQVVAGVRMPSETIQPQVGENGTFADPRVAYKQIDLASGRQVASFSLFQLSLVRLTPDNWDDFGCMGRPYLDASREVWQKLRMTEEDLVVRRRERAPLRTAHSLEGATETELQAYQDQVEDDQKEITTNYYMNKKGSVTAVQGDANLDQIADVDHLVDTFFSGAPAPKGLFGYPGDLSRDILEDLKRDFFDEIDAMQDTVAFVYEMGFRLDLLLSGMNPDNLDFSVAYAERRTETPNQAADRALKLQAMGASRHTVIETAGLDPAKEKKLRDAEEAEGETYPDDEDDPDAGARAPKGAKRPRVSITPSNARKGESATAISN